MHKWEPTSASSHEVQWGQSTTTPIGSPTIHSFGESLALSPCTVQLILLELEAYVVPEMFRNGLNMLPLRQIAVLFWLLGMKTLKAAIGSYLLVGSTKVILAIAFLILEPLVFIGEYLEPRIIRMQGQIQIIPLVVPVII